MSESWRQRLILAGGMALVVLLPLVVDLACLSPFRAPKSFLAHGLWALLAALFLAHPSLDPWAWPAAALVAAGAVSLALAGSPSGLPSLLATALALGGALALRQLDRTGRRKLEKAVVFAGLLQTLLAIAWYEPAARPDSFALLEKSEGRFQLLGTLGNPADVAVFLLLPTLLSLHRALSGKRRAGWWLCALLCLAGMVLSQTLSALAALALGTGVLLIRRLPAPKRLWAVVLSFFALLLLVLAADPLRVRLGQAWQEVRQGGLLWLASARGAAWSAAWSMFLTHPVAGVGFGQFEAHSFRFLPPRALAERARVLGLETGFGQAHNEYLQYLAETGLLGAALFLGGLVFAWRRRPVWPQELEMEPFSLLAAMAVLAAFQFPLQLAAIAAQWLVVLALLLPPLPSPGPRRHIAGVVGLVLWVGLAWVSWQQWRGYRALQAAQVLVDSLRQASSPMGKVVAAEAYRKLAPKLAYLPWDYQAETVAGNLAREAGQWDAALAHFRRALALAERPELRFNVGVTLLSLGQEKEGLAQLVRAAELNPAVLRVVTDRLLASKLRQELSAVGYFRRYPWTESWLVR